MNFLENFFRSSKQEKGRKYPGVSFLEVALKETYRRLGKERIDNLYRASLLGGYVGAQVMLASDERCLQKWGEGSLTKAVRLLGVWASTAVLILLLREENQEAVRRDTVRACSLLFYSDEGESEAELLAFQQATKSQTLRRGEPGPSRIMDENTPITGTLKDIADSYGIKNFSNEILYLRTLRALGDEGVPSFKLFPMPWGTLREMLGINPKLLDMLDLKILLNMEPTLFVVPEALNATLDTAMDCFKRMEAQG